LSTVGWVGSSREKSWQNATHTAFWDKTELIMRIAVNVTGALTTDLILFKRKV